MNKNYYAVIMAGGVGSRFWPLSKQSFPKQFHDMLGTGESLLQKTYSRLSKLIPLENIYILTNSLYEDLVKEQLPKITQEQIVLEPAMRNTAPCILLAALKIQKKNKDALMLVAPSDHWIEDENAFIENLQISYDACQREDILMTLGIKPSFPNTGYGYIKYAEKSVSPVKKVLQFTEKPDYKTAQSFLAEGNYLWNAGIFIWSVSSITKAFEKYNSKMFSLFVEHLDHLNTEKEQSFLAKKYQEAENVSIDYAIMEKAPNVCVLPATFDWNDLGSWGALHEQMPKDEKQNVVINAQSHLENTNNSIIRTEKGKVVVVDGLEDYIVVDNKEVLLIFPKGKEQDIKKIRATIQEKFGDELV
ncbi:mannose-1-phosphate guanylyltransferase [Mesonia aquimarina]|uniref:mannose-1-phosphate guanylyltransferase n=1 Tax=Mesonia aquimarina TaxID=1504967 RepID=UPI000EF5B36D|nr:mannose-1-phosphate guanylyltransferase [Mesonia aquimarina]